MSPTERMAPDRGPLLFTFAVISDSHVNEAEDRSVSPYGSNRAANARLRYVVNSLEAVAPAFVLHLGDMGNPLPHLSRYGEAARIFGEITSRLPCPMLLTPGNHCVGDKPVGWVPVPRVSRHFLELYERHYGPQWRSFDHGPCHFVLLNSLLINSGLRLEREQRRWLKNDLEKASRAGRRIWMAMHYPPYVSSPEEPASYDNLDEPGRTRLLEIVARHSVEVVYTGHVHNFFYNRYVDTEIYTLPAISFVRQDYSDLFSVAPVDAEGGRDDRARLGYCLVQVFERGHANHMVRTYGRTEGPSDPSPGAWRPADSGPAALAVGVEMRENWLARRTLRANNSISPFVRRWARNDWPLLALEESGISKLRVALQELDREDVLERLATLRDRGLEFLVYSYGIPSERQYRLVRDRGSLLSGWELILGLDEIRSVAGGIARLATGPRGPRRLPCYLSEVRDIARAEVEDANVKHEANYGFQVEEKRRIARLLRSGPVVDTFDGLVFRLRRHGESTPGLWRAIREVARLGQRSGMRHQAHVLFSGSLTADRLVDELDSANRVAEAAVAAWATENVDVYLDTFEDVDRGYFVRHGLVDRRYNPRLAARVLRHLGQQLAGIEPTDDLDGSVTQLPAGRFWQATAGSRLCALLLPQPDCHLERIELDRSRTLPSRLRVVDLGDGSAASVMVSAGDGGIRLADPLVPDRPLWLQAD